MHSAHTALDPFFLQAVIRLWSVAKRRVKPNRQARCEHSQRCAWGALRGLGCCKAALQQEVLRCCKEFAELLSHSGAAPMTVMENTEQGWASHGAGTAADRSRPSDGRRSLGVVWWCHLWVALGALLRCAWMSGALLLLQVWLGEETDHPESSASSPVPGGGCALVGLWLHLMIREVRCVALYESELWRMPVKHHPLLAELLSRVSSRCACQAGALGVAHRSHFWPLAPVRRTRCIQQGEIYTAEVGRLSWIRQIADPK